MANLLKTVRTLLLATLVLLPATAAAQHWQFQIGGGLSSQFGSMKSVGAYRIGVGYEYEFDQHWTFTPSIFFVGKGWRTPDTYVPVVDDNNEPVYNDQGQRAMSRMSQSTAADYVEIPLVFSYYHRLAESRYIVFGAGPYAAVGVAGKVKTKGDGQRIGDQKLFYEGATFAKNGQRRFDCGISAHLGYQFPSSLTIALQADFGLIPTSSSNKRNITGLVTLTYTLRRDTNR